METVLGGILAWAKERGAGGFLIDYEAEFAQVGPMLARQYENSGVRLQQLLRHSYKLVLRSITSKSTYQLLGDVDRYVSLLRAELQSLRQVYGSTCNQLNLKQADAVEYRPL